MYVVTAANLRGETATTLVMAVVAPVPPTPLFVTAQFGAVGTTDPALTTTSVSLTAGTATVAFSQPLEASAPPTASLTTARGAQSLTTSVTGSTVSISLPPTLALMTRHRIDLSAVTSAQGAIGTPLALSFVTEDGSWSSAAPVRISNAGAENVSYARIATLGQKAAVVWGDAQGTDAVRLVRSTNGTWGTPADVNTGGSSYFHFEAAISPLDETVFIRHQVSASDAICMTRMPTSNTPAFNTLAASDADSNAYTEVAIDEDGTAATAWIVPYSPLATTYSVSLSRFASGVWTTSAAIETDTSQITEAHVVNVGSGQFVAVWRLPGLGTSRFSLFSVGTGWVAPRSTTLGYGSGLALARVGDEAWLSRVYSSVGFANYLNVARYSPTSDAWGTATELANYPTTDTPSIAVRENTLIGMPNGEAMAVWFEDPSDTSVCQARARHFVPGVGWDAARTIGTNLACYLNNGLRKAVDGEGNISLLIYSTFGPGETYGVLRYQRGLDDWLALTKPADPFALQDPDIGSLNDGQTFVVGDGSSGAHIFAVPFQ